jgi:SnoaL-like domain
MDTLDYLSSVQAIKSCKARYVRGVDFKDPELFSSAFCDDGEWDLSGMMVARRARTGEWISYGSSFSLKYLEDFARSFEWPVRGRDSIRKAVAQHADDVVTFHQVQNPDINFTSDDTADVLWPFEDSVLFPEGSPVRFFNGRGHYYETYRRVADTWLIGSCKIDYKFAQVS